MMISPYIEVLRNTHAAFPEMVTGDDPLIKLNNSSYIS